MGSSQFDIGGLSEAAGSYETAAAQAATAQSTLAGLSLDPSALGGTPSAQALGAALAGFHSTQAQAVTGSISALHGFVARLHGVSAIGEQSLAETTAAAQL